jgi:putative transposase
MARLNFSVGTRFLWLGHVYVVRDILLEDKVRIEDRSFGGLEVKTLAELYDAWGRGELRFELIGRNTRKTGSDPVPTAYTFADFGVLPAHQKKEAYRRYQLIQPLLKLDPHERSKEALEKYAGAVLERANAVMPDPDNFEDLITSAKEPATETGSATAPEAPQLAADTPEAEAEPRSYRSYRASEISVSRSSLMRWLKDFKDSGYDIRSLVPATHERGGKGEGRLKPDVEDIISKVLDDCAAHPKYRTVQDVYERVVNAVGDYNDLNKKNKISLPSYWTVYRRITAANDATILRRRRSSVEAHSDKEALLGPRATDILERIEIDHTRLDIFVVDTEDRLPIGRPTLTLALDGYSGMPFGWYIGFEEASYLTVMSCLEHGILPKPDVRSLYETKHDWPVFGLPRQLIVDNGKEFVGQDLEDACKQLDIKLRALPVRSPWMKGAIERHFRSLNTGLVHGLPGTSFSNIVDKGDYDAMRNACISLDAFIKLMHIWLLDYFAESWHEGKRGIPARLWASKIENREDGTGPDVSHSAEDLRILLGRVEDRTLQPKGIEFLGLRYRCSDLTRMRTQLKKGETVRIKYDPRDIGAIHALDVNGPAGARWVRVPCVDEEYAGGLSLWAHEKIYAYARRDKKTVDIYALAETKRHLQKVVSDEFKLTRRSHSRRKSARFLGGVPVPAEAPAQTQVSLVPIEHTAHAAITDKTGVHKDIQIAYDDDDLDMTGYGADFGLPRQGQGGPTK